MSAVLPDILDRLKNLMTGAYAPARPIAAGEFVHVPFFVESTLSQSVKKPYPFAIEVGSTVVPEGVPVTTASSQIWSETSATVRVMFASYPDNEFERDKDIQRSIYSLRRTLGDHDSWLGLTGLSCVMMGSVTKEDVQLLGDDSEVVGMAVVVNVQLAITYREDYTT